MDAARFNNWDAQPPFVRMRINTCLMRELFTTFYEENCYSAENLKKILYIYVKNYLRFNDEISELQQHVNKIENNSDHFSGLVKKSLDFVKNASMETFFSQILEIKMPAQLLVRNAKAPVGMKQKRNYVQIRFRYDLHKMKSFAFAMPTISYATLVFNLHNYYGLEYQYHLETFFSSEDKEFFSKTYDIAYMSDYAREKIHERANNEENEARLIENRIIFEKAMW